MIKEEMRKIDERDLEEFGSLLIDCIDRENYHYPRRYRWYVSHRWRNKKGKRLSQSLYSVNGNDVMSAQLSEVSLLGVGAVLRLERDAWSMAK